MGSSSVELLEGLLRELRGHRARHEAELAQSAGAGAARDKEQCRRMLHKVKQFLSSISRHCLVPASVDTAAACGEPGAAPDSHARNLLHPALELMQVLLEGSFCPHAKAVFGYGEVNSVAPYLFELITLLAEPSAPRSGAFQLLLDNVSALLGLLAGSDLAALHRAFEDTVELACSLQEAVMIARGVDTRDEHAEPGESEDPRPPLGLPPSRVQAFAGLARLSSTAAAAAASASAVAAGGAPAQAAPPPPSPSNRGRASAATVVLPRDAAPGSSAAISLDTSSTARLVHSMALANWLGGLFARDFPVALTALPAHARFIALLCTQLERMAAVPPRSLDELFLARSVAQTSALVIAGLARRSTFARAPIRDLRRALLHTVASWSANSDGTLLADPSSSTKLWTEVGAALRSASGPGCSRWDEVELGLVLESLTSATAASPSLIESAHAAFQPLLEVFEAAERRDSSFARHVGMLFSGDPGMQSSRALHAGLARALAAAAEAVFSTEPDAGVSLLSKILALARKRRHAAPLHGLSPAGGSPSTAPRALAGGGFFRPTVQHKRARLEPLLRRSTTTSSSATDVVEATRALATSGAMASIAREALQSALVNLFTAGLGAAEHSSNEAKRRAAEASMSILTQVVLTMRSALEPSHAAIRATLELASAWLRHVTSAVRTEQSQWTLDIAVDIGLALALKIHQAPEATTDSIYSAASCVQGVLSRFGAVVISNLVHNRGTDSGHAADAVPPCCPAAERATAVPVELCLDEDHAKDYHASRMDGVTQVLWGTAALTRAMKLHIAERILVLASNFPVEWFCTDLFDALRAEIGGASLPRVELKLFLDACTSLLGAGLMNGDIAIRARAMVQIPSLLGNLRLRRRVLERYCAALADIGASQPISQASDTRTVLEDSKLQILRGFLVKLGSWVAGVHTPLPGTADDLVSHDALCVLRSAVHTSARLSALPLVRGEDDENDEDDEDDESEAKAVKLDRVASHDSMDATRASGRKDGGTTAGRRFSRRRARPKEHSSQGSRPASQSNLGGPGNPFAAGQDEVDDAHELDGEMTDGAQDALGRGQGDASGAGPKSMTIDDGNAAQCEQDEVGNIPKVDGDDDNNNSSNENDDGEDDEVDEEEEEDAPPFNCTCHTTPGFHPMLGDVSGSILLFQPWLEAVFFKAIPCRRVATTARVAMVRCAAAIFRRVVHIGASQGKQTVLHLGRFGEMASILLGLLEDSDEEVRMAVANEVSLFVEGCGGGLQFIADAGLRKPDPSQEMCDVLGPSVPEDAPGRCDLLRSMFGFDNQTGNVSALMKKLRHLVAKNQRRQADMDPESHAHPVSHALLHAIGTIGCTADVSYAVGGVPVGSNFLSWALLMLTQQYAVALAWSHELEDKLQELAEAQGQDGPCLTGDPAAVVGRDGTGQEGRNLSSDQVLCQLEVADSLKALVRRQFGRIAAAHQLGGSDGTAIRRLFSWMRRELYPQLFVMLLSEPLVSRAPDALEELLFSVFELSAEDARGQEVSQGVSFGSVGSGSGRFISLDRQEAKLLGGDSLASMTSEERNGLLRSVFTSGFVRNSLPYILPELLKDLNVPVLSRVATYLYRAREGDGEADENALVRHLIIDNYAAWIVEMVELVTDDPVAMGNSCIKLPEKDKENIPASGGSAESNGGWIAWTRLVKIGKFKVKELFEMCLHTILARLVFKLVDHTGQPDESAERVLTLLAFYSLYDPANMSAADELTISNADQLILSLVHVEFMYMMGVLSECIQERWRPLAKRCHAIKCVRRLLALLQNKVDVFLPKILPTVRAALQEREPRLQLDACELMFDLVQSLTMTTLQANLSSLVVSLLPCLRPLTATAKSSAGATALPPFSPPGPSKRRAAASPRGQRSAPPVGGIHSPRGGPETLPAAAVGSAREVSEEDQLVQQVEDVAVQTLHWLVVTNRDQLFGSFADIHELLPTSHPSLKEVIKVLVQVRGKLSLEERLKQLIKLIQHEADSVRLLALEELRSLLVANVTNLHRVLLDKTIGERPDSGGDEVENEAGAGKRRLTLDRPGQQDEVASVQSHRGSASAAESALVLETNETDRKGNLVPIISELIGTLLRVSRTVAAGGSTSMTKARTTRQVRLACSECLGELGAIDPSRLDLAAVHKALTSTREVTVFDSGQTKQVTGLSLDLGNEQLAAFIIDSYLVDALRAAPDPGSHMQVGMAIQEILRFFKSRGYMITDDSGKPVEVDEDEPLCIGELGEGDDERGLRGGSGWGGPRQRTRSAGGLAQTKPLSRVFKAETLEIITPFWTTNYQFEHNNCSDPRPRGRSGTRYFGPEVPFETSVGDWFAHLALKCKGEQSAIMHALLVLQTYSGATDLLLFLLPYAIQNVLCLGDNKNRRLKEEIGEEIMDVLRETWRGESCPEDDDGNAMDPAASTGSSSESKPDSAGRGWQLGTSGRIKKNAYAMFILLDTLAAWDKQMNINVRQSARTRSESASLRVDYAARVKLAYNGDFETKAPVSHLLRHIPVRCLAEAAFRCGAYARSLKYFESHVRSTHAMEKSMGGAVAPGAWLVHQPVQLERDEITFLHAVYAALESEPDGLVGVATLRSRHDGGPGTGYLLGKTKRTVSKWPPAEDQRTAQAELRGNMQLSPRNMRNKVLKPPPGTQPGDGGQPTLQERTYELEFNSRWDEAIACYESALTSFERERLVAPAEERDDQLTSLEAQQQLVLQQLQQLHLQQQLQRQRQHQQLPHQPQPQQQHQQQQQHHQHQQHPQQHPQQQPQQHSQPQYPAALADMSRKRPLNHDIVIAVPPRPRPPMSTAELRLVNRRLNCLRRLAHLDLIVSLTEGGATDQPDLYSVLSPYCQEALWRLGRWDELAEVFENSATTFVVSHRASRMLDSGPGNMGSVYTEAVSRAMLSLARSGSALEESAEQALLGEFSARLDQARLEVMENLSAGSMESYAHAYPLLIRLQSLAELRSGWEVVTMAKRHRQRPVLGVLGTSPVGRSVAQLNASRQRLRRKLAEKSWDDRFKITAPSVEMREELFEVRRVIYHLAGLKAEEMSGWLSLAKTSRQTGKTQSCLAALQRVQECADVLLGASSLGAAGSHGPGGAASAASLLTSGKVDAEVALCKAKVYLAELYHQVGDRDQARSATGTTSGVHQALMVLEPVQPNLQSLLDESGPTRSHNHLLKSRAKSLLFATNLMVESAQRSGHNLIQRYRTVQKMRPDWEKGHFYLAKLFERILENLVKEEEEEEELLAARDGGTSGGRVVVGKRRSGEPDTDMRESQLMLFLVMKEYGKSLERGGYDHLYESLPRLLTLWYNQAEVLHPLLEAVEAAESRSPSKRRSRQSSASLLMASRGTGSPTRDAGAAQSRSKSAPTSGDATMYRKMNRLMLELCDNFPAFVWYTAIPQLVSRLEIPSKEVWAITKSILIKVLHAYPAQAFWNILGVMKSNVEERRVRAEELFHELISFPVQPQCFFDAAREGDGRRVDLKSQFQSAGTVFDFLIAIARFNVGPGQRKLELDQVPDVDVRLARKTLSRCMLCLPTQAALSAVLPSKSNASNNTSGSGAAGADGGDSAASGAEDDGRGRKRKKKRRRRHPDSLFEPETDPELVFGSRVPMVCGFGAVADIMSSKEKPKKIQLQSSDGRSCNFLCKNENRGDLRKDARTMEFTSVVNKLFQRDPDARQRKLSMRTFSVICLNETCGLIEWVENTTGFRYIVQRVYAEEGEVISLHNMMRSARAALDAAQADNNQDEKGLIHKFRNVCEMFPPMTHKWFLNHFVEPEAWLEARSLFTRSCAVWSMVGHIIGLGDRHAENVLIDFTSGECVHVDFDCLFDKGLTLQKPELMPFRLTRHMVDGMDLGGVDGAFRRVCEVSLQVLRDHRHMLLSVLESFVVDPLVEWTRVKQTQGSVGLAAGRKRRAAGMKRDANKGKRAGQNKLRAIRERLEGIVRERVRADRHNEAARSIGRVLDAMPLSTQGQVHHLIEEATSEVNLAKAYSGWSAFL